MSNLQIVDRAPAPALVGLRFDASDEASFEPCADMGIDALLAGSHYATLDAGVRDALCGIEVDMDALMAGSHLATLPAALQGALADIEIDMDALFARG